MTLYEIAIRFPKASSGFSVSIARRIISRFVIENFSLPLNSQLSSGLESDNFV